MASLEDGFVGSDAGGWVTGAGKRECGGSVPRAITGAGGRAAVAVRPAVRTGAPAGGPRRS